MVIPAMWKKKAPHTIRFMPNKSTSAPLMIMVKVNPKKTGAKAVPKSWLDKLKSEIKTVSSEALTANETEVVMSARQLVINSLFLLIVSIISGFKCWTLQKMILLIRENILLTPKLKAYKRCNNAKIQTLKKVHLGIFLNLNCAILKGLTDFLCRALKKIIAGLPF